MIKIRSFTPEYSAVRTQSRDAGGNRHMYL